MKKIVSAAAIAAMAAGVASADVTISSNFRARTNLFELTKDTADNAADVGDTFVFNNLTGDWGDSLTFKAAGENAGINVVGKVGSSSWTMDYANAWFKYGNFTLTAGRYDERGFINLINGLDGNWNENYCGTVKDGLGSYGDKDVANVANVNGTKTDNIGLKYNINDTMNVAATFFKGGKKAFHGGVQFNMKHDLFNLNVTGKIKHTDEVVTAATADSYTLVTGDGVTTASGKDYYDLTGAALTKGDVLTANTVYMKKTAGKAASTTDAKTQFIGGIFVNPKIVDGLDVLVGYSLMSDKNAADDSYVTHGFDAHAMYTTGALKVYTRNTITVLSKDATENKYKNDKKETEDGVASLHTFGADYKVNDKLNVQLEGKIDSAKIWAADEGTINIRPAVVITPTKGACVTAGVDVGIKNAFSDADNVYQINVPMTFRWKL